MDASDAPAHRDDPSVGVFPDFELFVPAGGTPAIEKGRRTTALPGRWFPVRVSVDARGIHCSPCDGTRDSEDGVVPHPSPGWFQSGPPVACRPCTVALERISTVYDVNPFGEVPMTCASHPAMVGIDHSQSPFFVMFRVVHESITGDHRRQWCDDAPALLRTHAQHHQVKLHTALLSACTMLHDPDRVGAAPRPPGLDRFARSAKAKIAVPFRRWVSLNKRRLETAEYSLDLAYITPQIIAMGFPSLPSDSEHWLRNDVREVHSFLEVSHSGRFMVINLCSERSYPPSTFDGRFLRFPFDDHEPPPLDLLMTCVMRLLGFLDAAEGNVVAIHCKAGKGRTGVVIVALQFLRKALRGEPTRIASELATYADARTHDGKGVNIPSQLRFLGYFERCVRELDAKLPLVRGVKFASCTMTTTPWINLAGGCTPYVLVRVRPQGHNHREVFRSEWRKSKQRGDSHSTGAETGALSCVFDSRRFEREVLQRPPRSFVAEPSISIPLGSIQIEDEVQFAFFDGTNGGEELMCSCWIHTAFLEGGKGVVTLQKEEIDGANKGSGKCYFDDAFALAFHFSPLPPRERLTG